MPLFMTQFTYTADGWRSLVKNPNNHSASFRALFERLGGRVVAHYFSFGEYDSILIAEAPNETSMSSGLLSVIAEGHVKDIRTTLLLTPEQGLDAMKKAAAAPFRE
ncbi:MAG: GYD domain-containing protein [Thermoplasmata archaeon]|nr:GYD domain-containing protein [Thermoplasmata archaeon]